MNVIINFIASISKYLILIGGVILIFLLLGQKFPFLLFFFEEDPPKIEITQQPEGLGKLAQELKFKIIDNKSGIEMVRVRLDQARLNTEILKLELPLGTSEKEITIPIDSKALNLRQGNVRISIEVYDRSLKSNGGKTAFDLPVRFDTPSLELLTTQHNTIQGGMELVFYKVLSDKVKQTGVRVRDKEYIGFPANLIDPDFDNIKGIYFSFFVIPFDFSDEDNPPEIYARNSVGNESTQTFYYKVKKIRQRSWKYEVSNFKDTRFAESSLSEYLSKLPLYNKRMWSDRITKPSGNSFSPGVGDYLSIIDHSGVENKLINDLITFRYPSSKALNSPILGHVVVALQGKGYGKILVIDHGFGLNSIYSNLSDITVTKDKDVGIGTPLGSAGNLAQSPESGFEYGLFYQGTPVRPEEWWDSYWVKEHILDKIAEMKKRLAINVPLAEPETTPSESLPKPLPVIRSLDDINDNSENNERVRDF